MLTSFAFASLLGMNVAMDMEAKDGQMSRCPFMAEPSTMCQMGVVEHIVQWQQAFLGIPSKQNFRALAMVLLAVVIVGFVKPFSRLEELTRSAARLFDYYAARSIKVFDKLLSAFSEGILNPKIYWNKIS